MTTQISSDDRRDTAVEFVKGWVRCRFGLESDAFVSISEFACHLPYCPPKETLIMFWTPDRSRTVLKVHKAVTDIGDVDLSAVTVISTLPTNTSSLLRSQTAGLL